MAQEIHRWRSSTGDPLLAGSWDSAVAPGTAAYADLTFTGAAANNDTVTIASIVYTFKSPFVDGGAAREVKAGASATESAANLAAAINAGAGAGTAYSTATVAHKLLVAAFNAVLGSTPSAGVMRASLNAIGVGSMPTISEVCANASWGAPVAGVKNWGAGAFVVFDGGSAVACQGTDRLGYMSFLIRQTENDETVIGSSALPFQWDHWGASGQHILEGGGDAYLGHLYVLGTPGTGSQFLIKRLPGSYLEFKNDSGDIVIKIVESGDVSIKGITNQNLDPIYADGLDAHITIVSGKPTSVWSRNGRIDCDSPDVAAAKWTIFGGVVQNKGGMDGSYVMINGGSFTPIPIAAPPSTDVVFFIASGGVLDLSQSAFSIVGRVIERPGSLVIGGAVNPVEGLGGV
jgi:hypothetical protein